MGARDPAEDAGARAPRREANSPANRDAIVGWTTAGAMVIPPGGIGGGGEGEEGRRARQTRRGEARGRDAISNGEDAKRSGSKRRARGSGRRDARRALGDARARRRRPARGSRRDRARETRRRAPRTGARVRGGARDPSAKTQNRTLVRRRAQESPFNRSSGPPKGALEPPSAGPRALPLAHSRVLLEETRSRQDRAPSAMARARRSPPRHLRPSQNRLVGRASNGNVRRSKNPPGFRPRVRRGHGRRLPPQVSSGAQSQCAHDWLTVCSYGNHKLETWASKPARAERMTIVASSDERVR